MREHANEEPAVRRTQRPAPSTGSRSLDRRGFLHRSALVIGAFLVGLGRTESAFAYREGNTFVTNCCSLCCPDNSGCSCDENRRLLWVCRFNGANWRCIECYRTTESKQQAGHCRNAALCPQVDCSKAERVGDEDSTEERAPWHGLDGAIGSGCTDPETGEYIPWAEPGTPCDDRDPEDSTAAPI